MLLLGFGVWGTILGIWRVWLLEVRLDMNEMRYHNAISFVLQHVIESNLNFRIGLNDEGTNIVSCSNLSRFIQLNYLVYHL